MLTYWFLSRVAERLRVCVNSLSLNLVCPATIVSETAYAQVEVRLSHAEGFAVIQRLDSGELLHVALKEVGQLQEAFTSLFRSDESPCLLERLTCSGDGNVNVLLCGFVNGYDGFLVGRVDHIEGLAIDTFDKFVVDKAAQ